MDGRGRIREKELRVDKGEERERTGKEGFRNGEERRGEEEKGEGDKEGRVEGSVLKCGRDGK